MKSIGRILLFCICVVCIASGLYAGGKAEASKEPVKVKYTFYDVFWDAQDPNLAWFTKGAKDFMVRFPEVRIEVVSAEKWGAEPYLRVLETVMAKKPDGLVICVVDPVAIEGTMKMALAQGIPVVQATLKDTRGNALPYLTYMGGDEYLSGKALGERLLKEFTPKHVVTAMEAVGHAGAELRAQGMGDVVTKVGAKYDKLMIGDEQSHAKSTLTAFLTRNPDVDAIFTTAMFATEWIYSVMQEMGRTDIKLVSVDESPLNIEGILQGKVLATFSQGFYAQATMPYAWLYYYLEYGITPPREILTGPIVVDKSNVAKFKKTALEVFGEEIYKKTTPW
jgi:simple sugar transport system substrate-binding protein